VAYTAISSEEGFSAARVAGGEDSVEASKIVVDDSGVYGGVSSPLRKALWLKGWSRMKKAWTMSPPSAYWKKMPAAKSRRGR